MYNIIKVVKLKKRLIWLLGLGLTLVIVPFIINVYSIFRLISLIIGIILIMIIFCLKKKRSIFLIISIFKARTT